ncbi:hypothetical protein PHISP_03074 [Aspergillus sp. HF37]|nr:hypothetical protein PHISP_03074 [Aspergillus sp. HF37]
MARRTERPVTRQKSHGPSTAAACEACRRLKMRCIRPTASDGSHASTESCERCKRNNRTCAVPPQRPLGRRPGAVGRYQGLQKASRRMQAELRKARVSTNSTHEVANMSSGDGEALDHLLSIIQNSDSNGEDTSSNQPTEAKTPAEQVQPPPMTATRVSDTYIPTPHASREPVSNPLALLADASDAAPPSPPIEPGQGEPSPGPGIGWRLLHQPGYISLELNLSRDSLETGLDALFGPSREPYRLQYFRPADTSPPRDVGPDLDPVELALISMEEAYTLFPIYFARLHPFNGILDPMLHTADYVRSQSALLFTWILALTAQFDQGSAGIAKRLRLHGEKLSRHVHTCGYKSVEIVQGYYISLLSATPARTLSEERSWLYTMYAVGVASELGLDQVSRLHHDPSATYPYSASGDVTNNAVPRQSLAPGPANPVIGKPHGDASAYHSTEDPTYLQRLARNRERTWLRILLWERANSAACGRMNAFPETELTRNIESWWMHPLADSTDKHTCAFILLRCHLASLHVELRRQAAVPHTDANWASRLINTSLEPWLKTWLPPLDAGLPHCERLPTVHLYHVYIHNRLWTLSFALHASINGNRDISAIQMDCFEAAVHCCEVAVHDLRTFGEPLYCMLAPTWAMISYAAVLALKLFPHVHGSRPRYQIELLALLGQVALQLERAGTTPSHRLGIAALLGQHLLRILRAKAAGLGDAFPVAESTEMPFETRAHDPMVSTYNPLLTTVAMGTQGDLTGDGFADLLGELFGPGEIY